MKKNNRIFEKEKNISANRDGHFYDDYLGKNTFRKEVVRFLSKLRKGGPPLFRSTTPSQPLNTEPGDHLLLMGPESWSEELSWLMQLLALRDPRARFQRASDYLLQCAVWGGRLEGWRDQDTG